MQESIIKPEIGKLQSELGSLSFQDDSFYVMIKVIIQINSFFLCDKNSGETKSQVRAYFVNKDASFMDRVDNVF